MKHFLGAGDKFHIYQLWHVIKVPWPEKDLVAATTRPIFTEWWSCTCDYSAVGVKKLSDRLSLSWGPGEIDCADCCLRKLRTFWLIVKLSTRVATRIWSTTRETCHHPASGRLLLVNVTKSMTSKMHLWDRESEEWKVGRGSRKPETWYQGKRSTPTRRFSAQHIWKKHHEPTTRRKYIKESIRTWWQVSPKDETANTVFYSVSLVWSMQSTVNMHGIHP